MAALPYVRPRAAPKSLAPNGPPPLAEIAPRLPGCTGKTAFRTVKYAVQIMKPKLRRNRDYRPVWVYRCKHCRLYHVTTHPTRSGDYHEIHVRPSED